jgi:cytochrome b6-f complex iron-sulfur subunit
MAKAKAVAAPKEGINRREFLYYIWGASLALFTAELTGLIIWFAIPRFREGEFGGNFVVSIDALPGINEPPAANAEGRFWLVNLDTGQPNNLMYPAPDEIEAGTVIKGVAAVYKVCTHLGCIYAWNDATTRFECPCHGSKYRLDGRRVESPAPRTLDRFELSALDASGAVLATAELDADDFYAPLVLPENTASLQVNTGQKKNGPQQTLICSFTDNC